MVRSSTARSGEDPLFSISLAQWSLHRSLRSGKLDTLEFAAYARDTFGIAAVEYVNQFFADKATDFDYLGEMKARAADAGVASLLIMIDGEGALADADAKRRAEAIANHHKWIVAASFLGCHSIRVNAAGSGEREAQAERAAESLVELAEFGDQYGIDVIVENHGGLSSDGSWLADVMKRAGHPGVGTLPDFGNFHLGGGKWYDRYRGVEELMPYAKAVSAKSHEFDGEGLETKTDYRRMLKIVLAAGYRGHVGIEYEGGGKPEDEGIELTRDLLVRVRDELS
jgi:sugar phosphate isomerase/epimerase